MRCPDCRSSLDMGNELTCHYCRRIFFDQNAEIVRLLPGSQSSTKEEIQSFWRDKYRQWYESDDRSRTGEILKEDLALLEDLFRRRGHLAVKEMALENLEGKEVLEVGSGAGGHSALFRMHAAHVTSVDITPERVASTMQKLDLLCDLSLGSGLAMQADAENLPFSDAAFDIVYSNGVLHHTESTQRCIEEIFRVLKPGGRAVIMLYARHSAQYWFSLVPWGILTGRIFWMPEPRWLGRATEGTPKNQEESNPITRVFTKRQVEYLFHRFDRVALRRNGFFFTHLFPLPRLGLLRDRIVTWLGTKPHSGGKIVYGNPIIPETPLELRLGRKLGFCWNIQATKGP